MHSTVTTHMCCFPVCNYADAVRAIDPTRYVTSAIPSVEQGDEPDFAALDVGGYNYSPGRYGSDHAQYPDRVMVGTESLPTSSFEMWDHVWNSSWVVGDFIWTSIDVRIQLSLLSASRLYHSVNLMKAQCISVPRGKCHRQCRHHPRPSSVRGPTVELAHFILWRH